MNQNFAIKLSYFASLLLTKLNKVRFHNSKRIISLLENNFNNNNHSNKHKEKFLLVPNHAHPLDGNFILSKIINLDQLNKKNYVSFVLRKEILDWKFVGWVLSKTNLFCGISRSKGGLTNKVHERLSYLINNNGSLLMFIQGSSFDKKFRYPPKSGPIRVALKNNAKIIPVGIAPSHRVTYWKALKGESVHITFGRPISFPSPKKGLSFEENKKFYRQLTNELWDEIQKLMNYSEEQFRKELSSTNNT